MSNRFTNEKWHITLRRHNLEANNGRNLSSRPGQQRKVSKVFVLSVNNIWKAWKSPRADLLSETAISRANELMVGTAAFSSHQTSQKMLWQFFWCQRVSVWLQGMCLHSNIWGLIINIRNFFFLRRNKYADKLVTTKLTGFCHKNCKEKCGVFWPGSKEYLI